MKSLYSKDYNDFFDLRYGIEQLFYRRKKIFKNMEFKINEDLKVKIIYHYYYNQSADLEFFERLFESGHWVKINPIHAKTIVGHEKMIEKLGELQLIVEEEVLKEI